eukprot:s4503_g1.t1
MAKARRKGCCGCGYVQTIVCCVLLVAFLALAGNVYILRPMGLRLALGLGLVMAAAGDCPEGQCPSKRNAGVRLLQQNQRVARQNLESSTKASVHSSVLQKMLSKPVPLKSVHAERSADGMTAFVHFEHDGFRHSYNLSAYDVYSHDAQLFMQTSEGSQPLPREPRVYRSRSPQMWATAQLHADGSQGSTCWGEL